MALDFSTLDGATRQLEKAIQFSVSDLAKNPELVHPNPQIIDELEFKDLIRERAQRGYIKTPELWSV